MAKLRANIEPTLYNDQTAEWLLITLNYYDLVGISGKLGIKVCNQNSGTYFAEQWDIPSSVLEMWGTDDTILAQAYADEKGFIITSFEE